METQKKFRFLAKIVFGQYSIKNVIKIFNKISEFI